MRIPKRAAPLFLTLLFFSLLFPALSVQAQTGSTARQGDFLDFTVTASNSGPIIATAVTVTDPLDVSLDTPTNISNGGTYNSTTRTITWTGLSVPAANGTTPGTILLTFRAAVKPGVANGTVIHNTATITPPAEGGPGATVSSPPVTVATPDLSTSTKTVAGQTGPASNTKSGDNLTYTVTVINTGTVTATAVTITDVVNSNLGIPTAISNNGVYDGNTRTITWTGLTVAAANGGTPGTLALTFQAQVKPGLSGGTVIGNTAHISPPKEGGPGGDPKAPDLTINSPNLSSSTKTVAGQAGPGNITRPGDALTYTVNVINSGVVTATGVTVTDVVDANLNEPTDISNGGTYNIASRTITWTGLTIPAATSSGNSQLALTFKAKVKDAVPTGGKVNNAALISPPLEGGPGATPSAPELTVTIPTIQFQKTVTGVGAGSGDGKQLKGGDEAEYTVRLTNPNTTSLMNLVFTDGYTYNTGNWPNMQGTTYVGNSATVALDPVSGTTLAITAQPLDGKAEGNLVVSVGELLPNQTLVVKFRVKLSANAADIKDGRIENQAYTTSDEVKNISVLGGKLPSDDPTTQALNDPTISSVLTATATPVATPTASPKPTSVPTPTAGPTPTGGPAPAYTGKDGALVSATQEQDGLPIPVLLGGIGLLVVGIGAGSFYFLRGKPRP